MTTTGAGGDAVGGGAGVALAAFFGFRPRRRPGNRVTADTICGAYTTAAPIKRKTTPSDASLTVSFPDDGRTSSVWLDVESGDWAPATTDTQTSNTNAGARTKGRNRSFATILKA